MRPVVVRVGPLAAAAAGALAQAQAGASGVPLLLNGPLAAPVTSFVLGTGMVTRAVATPDMPRRVGITSSGNDAGIAFAITGTNWSGQPIGETLAGANAGQAQSVLDYATVTSVVPSGAVAGTVSVDTTAVASSPWVRLDHEGPGTVGIQAAVTGTVTATVEQSFNNPVAPANPTSPDKMVWLPIVDPAGIAFTTSRVASIDYPPTFVRVTLTAGSGQVTTTFVQSGGPGPT